MVIIGLRNFPSLTILESHDNSEKSYFADKLEDKRAHMIEIYEDVYWPDNLSLFTIDLEHN